MEKDNKSLVGWLEKKYPFQRKCVEETAQWNDEDLVKLMPQKPSDIAETLHALFPGMKLYQTNVHNYTIPIHCYSILEGSQFSLNEKFSNTVSFSSSNNNYQNLYLSYKKSTILKKLQALSEKILHPTGMTNTSIPALVVKLPTCIVQVSIDRYEGYYNNLFFNTYKRLHKSFELLFDAVDLLHQTLFQTNQHLSTLTRVMVVQFLHSVGIPALQDAKSCGSKRHVVYIFPALCTIQNVEWCECPDCIASKIPNYSFSYLLTKYLDYYLNFDYSKRISTSPNFYKNKPVSKDTVMNVVAPFVPWVLLSTSTSIVDLQEMLFIYRTVYVSMVTKVAPPNFCSLQSNSLLTYAVVTTVVMLSNLPLNFQIKQLTDVIFEVGITCEFLFVVPAFVSKISKRGGVIFLRFENLNDSAYFRWTVPVPYDKTFYSEDVFIHRPNGALYFNTENFIFVE
ncbi:hypothetical protein EIN_087130 [Entamoeba invadens IP1]|uniref:hypothetical protein n=1 Tax=Entamoeba invadens IP1 TaxID=370355 RepID=UPI0002C3F667|nr:hypothetical protein EIN_087130 [Entamoeba invadens IP1]ELP85411.1 hypothetical protein EIN_087130 [Entamoeba invadens IP1]|eukprot:XP_004184757.1 hypothetical protein EIN_087130 [Entamoeba invadens IP1]